MRRAIFPGSFDPFTIGHADIVRRGLDLFDEVIIAVGRNINKPGITPAEVRKEAIERAFQGDARVRVVIYNELTVDLAKKLEAQFILRGARSSIDFEYERSIAEANAALAGLETVLLYSKPELAYISSTLVRDLQSYGKDVKHLLP